MPVGTSEVAKSERETATSSSPGATDDSLESRLRSRSSPLVRRIAAENHIELSQLTGSGRLGRVTKNDILAYLARRGEEPEHARRAPTAGAGTGGLDWDEFYGHVQHPTVSVGEGDRVEPMGRMTQLIAEHMVLSRRISPHVHSYFEVDYTRIDQHRARNRSTWESQGVKVSYTAYIARAVALALREFPKLNASVSGESIVYRGEVNLGIAVAIPRGLIVPVVRRADELSITGIARRIADLAERARSKKLAPEEVQGGSFTITNPGVFGSAIGTPIINQPQAAILCVGSIEKQPAVITVDGTDTIAIRTRGMLSLAFDHRIVDGADADRFMADVKKTLQEFPEAAI